ncbi:hypothetical protein NHX12_030488 [Muraenolepis orangiensis]|uniref:Angiogenic factor with G patch and FHA domains 1 n=1 Tax=Muraenolepis orangiensis TaxID=630683 RepID=A0A9Q0IL56_9TELE|nr:hypothetical protein NHX12_030488 [Muraenolepis orangiensis]
METHENNVEESSGVAELQLKVESLKQQLYDCRAELAKLQKQLSHSERLQKNTENYNEDLRKQVDQLSAEIHQRKKKEKGRVDCETQTEEYTWTETDYYNYYYGGHETTEAAAGQDPGAADVGEATPRANEAPEVPGTTEAPEVPEATAETVPAGTGQPDSGQQDINAAPKTEASEEASIADMLRATAEQAMTQTGFVFDETTGMYYDHSTGFYYDSASQLYYDNNTGIYYCYDADSGRYQFHSKIEVAAADDDGEPGRDHRPPERKGRPSKKGAKKVSQPNHKEVTIDGIKLEDHNGEEEEWVERRPAKRKTRRPSSSPDVSKRRKDSSRERRKPSVKRKKQRNGSPSSSDDEEGDARKKRKASSDDSEGDSEPEEGELSESEGERQSSPSSSSSSSPAGDGSEVGTLFVLTADAPASIGREKDMDHAIQIAEMAVSKLHAVVYFDQELQCYMLVDQGSQNGTVLNGNRILQPKIKCEPCALTHGDEVKMGDTVLSFHIHSGTDTCDGCEPGQVMAHLSKHRREVTTTVPIGPVKEEKEVLRQKELRQMKAKYGLKSSEFEDSKALKNPRYQDRAQSRRQTVGSDGTFQRDDAPASVNVEISDVNKGRKMLEKMGWKRGDGLGKDGRGMKDPVRQEGTGEGRKREGRKDPVRRVLLKSVIFTQKKWVNFLFRWWFSLVLFPPSKIQLKIRKSQSGLGTGAVVSVDEAGTLAPSRSSGNWQKARERFADTCGPGPPPAPEKTPKAWLKAEDPGPDGSDQTQGSG